MEVCSTVILVVVVVVFSGRLSLVARGFKALISSDSRKHSDLSGSHILGKSHAASLVRWQIYIPPSSTYRGSFGPENLKTRKIPASKQRSIGSSFEITYGSLGGRCGGAEEGEETRAR